MEKLALFTYRSSESLHAEQPRNGVLDIMAFHRGSEVE